MGTEKAETRFVDHLRQGFNAGLLGLVFLGIMETLLVVWGRGFSPSDVSAFPWAIAAYGALGALGGFGLGVVGGLIGAILRRPAEKGRLFSLYWTVMFTIPLFVIARFRIRRDVFEEKLPTTSPTGILVHLLLLLVVVVLFFILYRFVIRGLVRRGGFRGWLSLKGALATFIMVLLIAGGLSAATGLVAKGKKAVRASGAGPLASGVPNIILIGIDTMRADHLSCYGYTVHTSPQIDRLAAEGIQFHWALGQSSWTKPGFATILTSLYPSSHRAIGKPDRLPQAVLSLPEVLRAHGYSTAGFANNVNVSDVFGFDQGFDYFIYLKPDYFFRASEAASELTVYDQLRLVRERFLSRRKYVQNYYQDATVVNRHVLSWLKENGHHPFFLFIHYMDPHDPYFHHPYDGVGYARVSMPNPEAAWAEAFVKTYDGEISFVDEHLGALMDSLRLQGLYDNSLIVLTSDHGEEFYEHKGWWHGTTLYDEQIHVPLIVKLPGGRMAGTKVGPQVRSLDIAPSVLGLAGVPIPAEMQGRNLFPNGNLAASGEAQVFSEEDLEGNVLRAVRSPDWKLVVANPGNPRGLKPQELYHLRVDPGETQDLAGSHQPLVADLKKRVDRIQQYALGRATAPEEGVELDQATRDRLKALGYVQ
jgi:arylsulfatase A-like enzyme